MILNVEKFEFWKKCEIFWKKLWIKKKCEFEKKCEFGKKKCFWIGVKCDFLKWFWNSFFIEFYELFFFGTFLKIINHCGIVATNEFQSETANCKNCRKLSRHTKQPKKVGRATKNQLQPIEFTKNSTVFENNPKRSYFATLTFFFKIHFLSKITFFQNSHFSKINIFQNSLFSKNLKL